MKDELDISGIGADVDGSDKGMDDLETEADNISDDEFAVLPTSLTHPAKEKDKSCGDVNATPLRFLHSRIHGEVTTLSPVNIMSITLI
jgi:hypothetical protein